jgi:pimeloyl-ACP methyl ester carboxylesterase
MIHGVCNPPEYACGLWQDAAPDLGFLVCPAGNASCGKAMYDAPTWTEPDPKIDDDLEASIAKTLEAFPDAIDRTDAVLCGFSKGAYVAVKIAAAHPGRWPYLVLNEANVTLSVEQLKKAGVRAVALVAGEKGGQINGEKATTAKLQKAGYPAKFWPMPNAGHYYSDDISTIMRDAIDFVTSVKAE